MIHPANLIAQRHANFDFTETEIMKIASRRVFIVSRFAVNQAKLRNQVYHMCKHGKLKLISFDGRFFKYRSINYVQGESSTSTD